MAFPWKDSWTDTGMSGLLIGSGYLLLKLLWLQSKDRLLLGRQKDSIIYKEPEDQGKCCKSTFLTGQRCWINKLSTSMVVCRSLAKDHSNLHSSWGAIGSQWLLGRESLSLGMRSLMGCPCPSCQHDYRRWPDFEKKMEGAYGRSWGEGWIWSSLYHICIHVSYI